MTPTDPHPLLGRLVKLTHPKTKKETSGQVVDFQGDRVLVKPSTTDKAFWVEQSKVHPEWVDHIGKALKNS
jgi:hypothetical protein